MSGGSCHSLMLDGTECGNISQRPCQESSPPPSENKFDTNAVPLKWFNEKLCFIPRPIRTSLKKNTIKNRVEYPDWNL